MADKKQKILIVDDSEMNRDILAVMLGSDYEILEAENGLEAIEILQQGMTDIDLILLDIMMPEMDGFDVLGFMKRSHMTEVIPVIMISSESSSSYILKFKFISLTSYQMSFSFNRTSKFPADTCSKAWTRSWIGRKKWWEMTVVMHREISAELQVLVRKGNQPIGG